MTAGANDIVFNFCEAKITNRDDLTPVCDNEGDSSFAYAFNNDKCTSILKADGGDPNTNADNIMLNSTELVAGVNLTFENAGSKCPSDETQPFKLNVEVMCQKGEPLKALGDPKISNNGCDVTLQYTADQGCTKFQYGILAQFMTQYSFLFGAILIIFGLILAFCGNKFLTVVITIMTALATLVIGVYFTALFVDSVFDPENVEDYAVWIILALWAIIAILAGWFIAKKRKWGLGIVGAFGGVMLGLLLTTVFGA